MLLPIATILQHPPELVVEPVHPLITQRPLARAPLVGEEILIDGYISQSFGPDSAKDYFYHLLKTNQSGLNQSCQTLLRPDGSGVCFVVKTIPANISPTPYMQDRNGLSLWLIDYSIARMGTVIPQARWSPENVNDHRLHVAEAILQMPIFFVQQNGYLGLSLDDAVNGRNHTLRDAGLQAQLGGKAITYIRIGVCGCWPSVVVFIEVHISGLVTTNSSD